MGLKKKKIKNKFNKNEIFFKINEKMAIIKIDREENWR